MAVQNSRDDQITLNIDVEDWIETNEADLTLSIEAAIEANDASAARTQILEAISEILDVDWRFVTLNRYTDRTGFERWQASVQQRVPESALNGLSVKAKAVSKPGLQIRIQNVDYTPTVEAFENFKTTLRTKVYERVAEELNILNNIYTTKKGGNPFRVGQVRFGNVALAESLACAESAPRYYANNAAPAGGSYQMAAAVVGSAGGGDYSADSSAGGDDVSGFSVSRKITLSASVVLSALVN